MTPWDYSGNAAKEIVWDETTGERSQVNASKATQAKGEFPSQARVVMLEQLSMSYSEWFPSPRITVKSNQLF